ncbi:hypothetical protein O1W69_04270 [Chlamydia sp. 12-01]|uniref:hypothetical protein n=1 Tax=Chlamydia sp. 12-01 TaxID=3002742 RepID=UPI0035D47D9C
MSQEKISSDSNPLPPRQLFNLTPRQRLPIKGYLNRVLYNPNTRETTQKVLAILGGIALIAGVACGITLGALGAPGLAVATAIGITLGTILLGTSLALLPHKTKGCFKKRIHEAFEKNRDYDFLSNDLAEALKVNFKESFDLPKDMKVVGADNINIFTAKNNSKVRLATFKVPSFFSSITDHDMEISRLCFIPPEADLAHPKTIHNSSMDLFRLEIGDLEWNKNLKEFIQTPKKPAGWTRTEWKNTMLPLDDTPRNLINVWNPFGHYPKTASEQPGDRRHPLYGKRSLEDQKVMFIDLFKSLMKDGIQDIGIYGNDLLFPKDSQNNFYINTFGQLDGDFDSRVLTALSLALAEIANDKKSNLTVSFYGMGSNPLRKHKPIDYAQLEDFDDDD